MKKILLLALVLLLSGQVFAQAVSEDDEVEVVAPSFSFMSSISLQWSPVYEAKADDGSGADHFAPITGINIPIPYFQFMAQYKIPLDFRESIVFQGANLLFVAGPTITPISLDNQLGVIFTPTPILSFGIAATAGTGWAIGESHGIGVYKPLTDEYEQCTPFAVWKYNFIFQTQFQFDFGIFFPSKWTHIIVTATEQLYYEGNTKAGKADPWEWMGSKDYVNGFKQAGNALIGYTIPDTILQVIGIGLSWQGNLSGSDYGIYDSNFNGSFIMLSVGLQCLLAASEKDQIAISTSIFSRRAFLETTTLTDACITKTASGREWCFNGLSVQWIHTF